MGRPICSTKNSSKRQWSPICSTNNLGRKTYLIPPYPSHTAPPTDYISAIPKPCDYMRISFRYVTSTKLMEYLMVNMQIPPTETLPTAETTFVALPKGSMPWNCEKKNFQFQLTSFVSNHQFSPLNWRGARQIKTALNIIALICLSSIWVFRVNGTEHIHISLHTYIYTIHRRGGGVEIGWAGESTQNLSSKLLR